MSLWFVKPIKSEDSYSLFALTVQECERYGFFLVWCQEIMIVTVAMLSLLGVLDLQQGFVGM